MKKKVGSVTARFLERSIVTIVLLSLTYCIFALDSSVVLRMQDMNHKPIDQAMCKAPFILQVELKNLEAYNDIHLRQYISGIENFKTSRLMSSHNISFDNGKKITKFFYNFVLRADKKGSYTIGPVSLKDKTGNTIKSNRLIIPVGDEVITQKNSQKDPYFLVMSIDKDKAYVGEKNVLRIKFYDRVFVDNLDVQFPHLEHVLIVKNQEACKKSMIVFDDEEYSVTEWVFDIYGTAAGKVMLQDIQAVFFAPELENKFKFDGAFDFFRSLQKTQQYLVVKPATIDIIPLPEHHAYQDVIAVGDFSNFTLAIAQDSVPAGQGVTLTARLSGNGNFELIPLASLSLPSGFNYYDSNMVTIDRKKNYKQCEFIVQAKMPGQYHIEPQVFNYFDPGAMQYKTLLSNALAITVTQPLQISQATQVPQLTYDELDAEAESVNKKIQDFPIFQSNRVHAHQCMYIPLQVYQRLLWFLSLLWLLLFVYRDFLYKDFFQPVLLHYIIFSRAKKACIKASLQQDLHRLYPIFMLLFTQLIGSNSSQINDAIVIQYLRDRGFSPEGIAAWNEFNGKILQASFSLQGKHHSLDLFKQALEWIQLLKEKA